MPKKTKKRSGTIVVNTSFLLIPVIDNFLDHDPMECVAIEFDERNKDGYRRPLGFFIKEKGGNVEYYGELMDEVSIIHYAFYPYVNLLEAEQAIKENWCGRDEDCLKSVKRQLKKNIKFVKKLEKEKKI